MIKTSLDERLQGAIWGQFVGDAAGLGTHNISAEGIRNHFPQGIQGFETPGQDSIHPKKKAGDFTHYGDAGLLLLQSLIIKHGFSARDFGTRFVETFAAPNSPKYRDKCAEETIENYYISLEEGHPDLGYEFQGGANNSDIDSATWLAPLIVFYWDDANLMAIVDKATRVTQNNELTVAYMRLHAKITRSLFEGKGLKETFKKEIHPSDHDTPLDRHVRSKILLAFDMESESQEKIVLKLGKSPALDQSFPCSVHAAINNEKSFNKAILDTLTAGGDGAGRAALVGTWLGAHLGIQAIPEEWKKSLTQYEAIDHGIKSLLKYQVVPSFDNMNSD